MTRNNKNKNSLKRIAMQFPEGSMERVLLHGQWASGRGKGRQPSMRIKRPHGFNRKTTARDDFREAEKAIGEYIATIRAIPFNRRWSWHQEVVDAVMAQKTPEEVRKVARWGSVKPHGYEPDYELLDWGFL